MGRKALKRKLGQKVLSREMTFDEARARLGGYELAAIELRKGAEMRAGQAPGSDGVADPGVGAVCR